MQGKDGRFYDPGFDFDGDGKLNGYEYSVMDDVVFSHNDSSHSSDFEEDDLEDELAMSGLDIDDLEMMDEAERIEALEDAGIDPDDFDF